MKIYSLQEENEKMNAARIASAPKGREPAMSGRPSSSGRRQPPTAAPQKNMPQNRKKSSYLGLIIWLLIMLLIFGGNILAQFLGDL